MYHYDKTIEKFDDYKLFLSKVEWPTRGYRFYCPTLPEDFLNKYANLLERFKIIDKLVEGYNESLAYKEDARNISYEEWYERGNYFSFQEEQERPSKIFSNMNATSIECLFNYYDICCNFFLTLFPNYKDFLLETKSMLDKAFNDLNARIYLKQNNQNQNKQVVMKWSKGWFILPNGEFYNSGLKNGHKEGRLIYSLNNIKDLLEEGKIFLI